jgi:histidine triad (HIT) family protein
MKGCLFCRIISREIPGKIVAEDDRSVALEDINPQAPVHLLVIPRKHIDRLSDLAPGDQELIGHLFLVANRLARERGVADGGYRTVINSGLEAGQTVFHLHLHVMGGRTFRWPPG